MLNIQKKYFGVSFALALLLIAPVVSIASVDAGVDQLIIKYRSDIQSRMSRQAFQQMAARAVSSVIGSRVRYKRPMAETTGAHVLKLPHSMSPEQARAYAEQVVQQYPQIDYAEPDYRRYIQRTITNDPELNQQWHLMAPEDFAGAANVVNAWDLSKGNKEIVVAVLDEGMTNHEDLRPAFVGGALAVTAITIARIARLSD